MYTDSQLVAKYQSAKESHLRWLQIYWEAYRYITPHRDAFGEALEYLDTGITNNYQIYNTTAPVANTLRANKLTRMLMPDNQRWGTLELSEETLDQGILTLEDVESAQKAIYAHIHDSCLQQQVQDAFVDVGIGSGAIWMDSPSDEEPLLFQSVPAFCVMPEFYNGNRIRDLWYIMSASTQYILDSYPEEEIKKKTSIKAYLDGSAADAKAVGRASNTHWIIRGIIHDPLEEDEAKRWRIVDMLSCGNKESREYPIIYDENFVSKKLVYFRDRVRPGEAQGRGPGIEFLPIIKRLNAICHNDDTADELRSYPPTEINAMNINPSMLTDFAGSAVPIGTFGKSLELPASPKVSEKIEKLQMEINEGFSIRPIGNLNQPVRTAEEITQRMEETKETTTIDVSRFLRESSKPIFENSFMMLLEKGAIPNSHKWLKVLSTNKKSVVFRYSNPLGDIEKNNNLLKLEREFQSYQQYLGEGSIMAAFDIAKVQDFRRDNSGLPGTLYKPGQQLAANMGKALQQQQDAEQQGQQAAGLPTPSTAPQSVNPLTQQGIMI